MSITVRLWSKEELQSLQKDRWLATIFMNRSTFGKDEIKYYPYNLRQTYMCEWGNHHAIIYATDEEMLRRFISEEYIEQPWMIHERLTKYKFIEV